MSISLITYYTNLAAFLIPVSYWPCFETPQGWSFCPHSEMKQQSKFRTSNSKNPQELSWYGHVFFPKTLVASHLVTSIRNSSGLYQVHVSNNLKKLLISSLIKSIFSSDLSEFLPIYKSVPIFVQFHKCSLYSIKLLCLNVWGPWDTAQQTGASNL